MSDDAAHAQADQLKQQGNDAYKKREFQQARDLYQQAWDTFQDVTYLNNLAAVYFEEGDYDKAIETCEKAVEEGRERRADFKLIAKAFGRIGSSYVRKEDYDNGIKYLQKSLTEHRTPDVLAKLKDAEKQAAEKARLAYIDPAKADAAREEGNTAFRNGDFATAVTHYAESIKRNPEDPRGYTNRAAAYNKLMALPEALKDAEKAIEIDPAFVKGYIRKSHVLFAMKEFDKALAAIETAAEKDTAQAHTKEITQQFSKVTSSMASSRAGETDEQTYARAMRDPEVQQIMADPAFQSILQQAQQDPKSLQQHMMQNADVRKKVEVLVRAGIIKTGPR
ncbi:stress-induced-phospho protein 1 [Rhodotorula diobovata]|uniref:Stress-induced-phospho protein 1 n=1 Tax=Rhodotorula diobovata TaxID=5288 RepID=A0A5C5FYZ7_9BASI|nr:stress-induced-phospho protein 1 [Rhodotorula diobovata]